MLYHPLLLSPVQEDDTEHDEELEETCSELHQSTGIPHIETVRVSRSGEILHIPDVHKSGEHRAEEDCDIQSIH